jgi:hypothetical protein
LRVFFFFLSFLFSFVISATMQRGLPHRVHIVGAARCCDGIDERRGAALLRRHRRSNCGEEKRRNPSWLNRRSQKKKKKKKKGQKQRSPIDACTFSIWSQAFARFA